MTARSACIVAGLMLAGAAGGTAWAHHSFAMFDNQKTLTLDGSVEEFRWTNPHIWIQLLVRDEAGKDVEWSIEGANPAGLEHDGWTARSLKTGDRAIVTIHPLKDGSHGGSLISVSFDGRQIGSTEP